MATKAARFTEHPIWEANNSDNANQKCGLLTCVVHLITSSFALKYHVLMHVWKDERSLPSVHTSRCNMTLAQVQLQ